MTIFVAAIMKPIFIIKGLIIVATIYEKIIKIALYAVQPMS